jgi:hypothetical protein
VPVVPEELPLDEPDELPLDAPLEASSPASGLVVLASPASSPVPPSLGVPLELVVPVLELPEPVDDEPLSELEPLPAPEAAPDDVPDEVVPEEALPDSLGGVYDVVGLEEHAARPLAVARRADPRTSETHFMASLLSKTRGTFPMKPAKTRLFFRAGRPRSVDSSPSVGRDAPLDRPGL